MEALSFGQRIATSYQLSQVGGVVTTSSILFASPWVHITSVVVPFRPRRGVVVIV
jgi:hypothetical protein